MKRILRISILGIIAAVIIAVPVLAVGYAYPITVTNANTSELTNTAFVASIDNTALVSGGYIASDGLDTAVVDGSTSLPHLVTDDSVWFVGDVPASGSKTVQYTSGNTPATSMPFITGSGGYVTIPYNADLELGSAWEIEWAGIPTATSVFAHKVDCYKIYMDSGSIYVQVGADISPDASVDTTLSLAYHTLEVGMDGTNLYIIVDSETPVTTAYSGSIPMASEVMTILQDVSYSDYFKILIGQISGGDFSYSPNWSISNGSEYPGRAASIYTDGSYLYEVSTGMSGYVDKISLATHLVVDSWIPDGINLFYPVCVTGDGQGSIYVGCTYGDDNYNGYASVVKLLSSDMSIVDYWYDSDTLTSDHTDSVLLAGDMLYAGIHVGDTTSAPLYKINPSTMLTADSWNWDSGSRLTGLDVTALASDSSYVYAGFEEWTGGIDYNAFVAQIEPTYMNADYVWQELWQALGGDIIPHSIVCGDVGSIYVGLTKYGASSLGEVVCVDTTTMLTSDSYSFLNGVDSLYYDNNGTLHAGVDNSPSAVLIASDAYDLSSELASISLDTNSGQSYIIGAGSGEVLTTSVSRSDHSVLIGNYTYTSPGQEHEILWYQPSTIISGITLPDLDRTQDGTITWGTGNPANVSITLGTMIPSNPAKLVSSTGATPGQLLTDTPDMPVSMYTDSDSTGIPGGAIVQAFLLAGDIPVALWWFPFLMIFTAIAGLLAYDATQRTGGEGSILVQFLVSEVLLIVLGTMHYLTGVTILPLWPAVPVSVGTAGYYPATQER